MTQKPVCVYLAADVTDGHVKSEGCKEMRDVEEKNGIEGRVWL